ncbi:MAG TPA: hypothetical protein ENO24_00085 [Chloroflexi bacterium]|nr:hypothetical protein [Chloroflexota bacterium]
MKTSSTDLAWGPPAGAIDATAPAHQAKGRHALRLVCKIGTLHGRRISLLLLLALAAVGITSALAFDPQQAEQELIILTNVDRTSNGVPALVPDQALEDVARFRSEDMVTRNYFSHLIPPDGHQVFDILKQRGINYLRAGENLARNNSPDHITVQTVEQAFMNSPRHRAILLCPDYTNLGTGVAEGAEGLKVYTVLFTQVSSEAPATATPTATPTPEPIPTSPPSAVTTPEDQVASASPTPAPTATAASIPSPTPTPWPTRVELSPARSIGLIQQIVRRILSLFLNLG